MIIITDNKQKYKLDIEEVDTERVFDSIEEAEAYLHDYRSIVPVFDDCDEEVM